VELETAIGKELRELRTQMRLTQESLAEAADIERNTISLIERGISSPTARNIWKLTAVLGTTPSHFFARVEARLLKAQEKKST